MAPGNKYTYKMLVCNDLIYSDWGHNIFFHAMGGSLQNHLRGTDALLYCNAHVNEW